MLFMYLYYLYLTLPWLICTTQDWCLNRQSDMWQHIITCLFIWNVQLHAFVSVCSYILLKYVAAYLKYAAACLKKMQPHIFCHQTARTKWNMFLLHLNASVFCYSWQKNLMETCSWMLYVCLFLFLFTFLSIPGSSKYILIKFIAGPILDLCLVQLSYQI